jgi:hypothetical protein
MMLPHSITPFASLETSDRAANMTTLGLMMIVRNQMLKTVLSLPFLAGCA